MLGLLLLGAVVAAAQPKADLIEVFGNRRVSRERILKALSLAPGAPMPKSRNEAESILESMDTIARAHLEGFCCEEGQTVLYIGVQERGQPGLDLRLAPSGTVRLPAEIVSVYDDFTQALARAAPEDLEEDLTAGHSLMRGIALRTFQQRFVGLAELHAAALREVLRDSADEDHRAIAAYVLGYAQDKAGVSADLQQALRDPAQVVRTNAARALKALAVLAARPESKITIRTTWFVEMLNAPALTDRLEGARALLTLFDTLSDQTRAHLRERALPALFEMARFQHLPHALPAYLILGKLADLPEGEIEQAWIDGQREALIEKARKALRK
jgi:hypothetical protein